MLDMDKQICRSVLTVLGDSGGGGGVGGGLIISNSDPKGRICLSVPHTPN